jgi:hypothetical protein
MFESHPVLRFAAGDAKQEVKVKAKAEHKQQHASFKEALAAQVQRVEKKVGKLTPGHKCTFGTCTCKVL